jgi:hypothetical protein
VEAFRGNWLSYSLPSSAKVKECVELYIQLPNTSTWKTWNTIQQETGKIHETEQMPSLLIKNEKIKDPGKVADVFSSFFQLLKI